MKLAIIDTISRYFFRRRVRPASLRLNKERRQAFWNGAPVNLPELSFQFLSRLAAGAPKPVTYTELVADVWAGVSVSQDAIKQRAKLVRDALAKAGADKTIIQAVRGVGYRFTAPIARERKQSGGVTIPAVTLAAALLLASVFFVGQRSGSIIKRQDTTVPIVAVSAFSDNTNQVAKEALTAELLAALGRLEGVRIVSSQTMESLRDMRPRHIARETGASIVVEGSIRSQRGLNTVDLRIVDAATEIVIWTAQYNSQTSRSEQIANHASRYVHDAVIWAPSGHRRGRDPAAMSEARRLYLEALRYSYGGTREGLLAASHMLIEALEHDHTFVEAQARLAELQARLSLRFAEPGADQAAIGWAEAAIQQAPHAGITRYAYGLALQASGAKEAAATELRLAALALPYADRDASALHLAISGN